MMRRRRVGPAVAVFPTVHGLAIFGGAVVEGGLPDDFAAGSLGLSEEVLEFLPGGGLAELEGDGRLA